MASELGAAFQAVRTARMVQRRINAAGPLIPEIQGRRDVVAAISGKNVFTPWFYSYANQMSQFWMQDTDINVPQLNDLGGAIIIIDEIAERMSSRELKCQPCIAQALQQMGLHDRIAHGSITCRALEDMYAAMQLEREYSELRQHPPTDLGAATVLSFQQYQGAVARSIGMMPFYASVAEMHHEKPDSQLKLLQDLEFATRILSDDITLGKDLKHNSLNIITEYWHYHPDLTLEQARSVLRERVMNIVGQTRTKVTGKHSPTLNYALNFVEVLENVSHLDDPGAQRSGLLSIIGSLISNFVYRRESGFGSLRKMLQYGHNGQPAVGLVPVIIVIILMIILL